MKPVLMSDIKTLIKQAVDATSSGHPFLDQRWLSNEGRNSHYRRQYYRFCQALSRTYQPEVVVELGIDEGDCVAHFASGCPQTKVYGIDVHKDSEAPSRRCKEVEYMFPNFSYWRGWTWDRLKDVAALNKPIDILFIDSWHTDHYLIRDWNDYHIHLKKGSIVLVDDLLMPGIGNVFDKLPGERLRDSSMTTDMGIMIYDGTRLDLPYVKQDYMP